MELFSLSIADSEAGSTVSFSYIVLRSSDLMVAHFFQNRLWIELGVGHWGYL